MSSFITGCLGNPEGGLIIPTKYGIPPLVAWHMDESSGIVSFASDGFHNLVNNGSNVLGFTPAHRNKCVQFVNSAGGIGSNGIWNPYQLINSDPTGSGNWTLAFWMKPNISTIAGNPSYIIGIGEPNASDSAFNVYLNNVGATTYDLNAQFTDDSGSVHQLGTGSLTINTWVFVVFSFDFTNGTYQLYVNGSLISQDLLDTGPINPTSTDNFLIGESPQGNYDYVGLIDEVMFFNRTLSATEISQLYAQ